MISLRMGFSSFSDELEAANDGSPSEISNISSSASSSPPCPLHDMSSLMQQLPFKRGLSKHFQGKSESFTSLANVRCLEDLAKPEKPYNNKKLKSCKRYGGLLEINHKSSSSHHPRTTSSSRCISRKSPLLASLLGLDPTVRSMQLPRRLFR